MGATSPLPLRLIHLLIFGGIALGGVLMARTDAAQLRFGWQHGFVLGRSPSPGALFAGAACAALFVALLAFVLRGPVPLWLSALVLFAFTAEFVFATRLPPKGWADADREILTAAESLQLAMNDRLQKSGETSAQLADWQGRAGQLGASPVTRLFTSPSPYAVRLVGLGSPLPPPAPGTLVVEVSKDRAQFRIHPGGVDAQGAPAYLSDEKGAPLVLKAVFNPNRASGDL